MNVEALKQGMELHAAIQETQQTLTTITQPDAIIRTSFLVIGVDGAGHVNYTLSEEQKTTLLASIVQEQEALLQTLQQEFDDLPAEVVKPAGG